MAAVVALKKELRKEIKRKLACVTEAAAAAQSSHAVRTLLSMPEYKAASQISVYLSMPSGEISTADIVRDALAQGKRVFIPYTYDLAEPSAGQPKSIMDMLELHSWQDLESFQPDKWNIPVPAQASLPGRLNSFGGKGITHGADTTNPHGETDTGRQLIVMPGMAFDAGFGRLGHGKGFYDYYLRRCHDASRMPFRVGLALTEQLLPPDVSVPMDTTDFRLDALITGDGQVRRAHM